MSNQRILWEGYFSMELCPGWELSEKDGVISIYDPNGVGALQFSFIVRLDQSLEIDLCELAKHFAAEVAISLMDIRETNVGNHNASFLEGVSSEEEAAFWRVWHVLVGSHVVFISYTCAATDQEVESKQVLTMVASIVWLS